MSRFIDLGALYQVSAESCQALLDAAATGVRAETVICGWEIILSHSKGRAGPWRMSAKKIDAQANDRFPFDLLKGLGCTQARHLRPLTEYSDSKGYWHWSWGDV